MTRLLVDPATDFDDPTPVAISATLLDPAPTLVRTFEGVTAATVVDLPAPDAAEAWRLTVRRPVTTINRWNIASTNPGPIIEERTVHFADGPTVAWSALTDVDPTTLQQPAGSPLLDVSLDELRTTLLGGASTAFDTLKELETALGDDANFAATVTAALAGKATPAQITAAISALGLGTASTRPATDFDPAGAAAAVTLTGLGGIPRQGFQGYRARDFPGTTALPTVGTGPTQTLSAANAASGITSSVRVMPSKEFFRVVGLTEPKWGTAYPDYNGWKAINYYPNGNTSVPPYAIEYELDSVAGVVEIVTKGTGSKVQTLVDGRYVSATPITLPNDGNSYLVAINVGAGGRYRVRHEFDGPGMFWGINIGPTDAVYSTPRRTIRALWMGDSFGEPTISDTGPSWAGLGLPTLVGWLTGWEVIHASKGGTGLVNAGTGVKYADRLTDVLTTNPGADVFILQLSSNDTAAATTTFMTQLQAIISSLRTAGFAQYGQIIVLGHWWAKQSQSAPVATVDQNAQAKTWCRANGVIYVDTLTPDVPGAVTTTVAGAATSGQSVLSIAAQIPATAVVPTGGTGENYVQIGNPGSTTLEIRKVATSGYSGAGPYNLNVTPSLTYNHAIGEQVVQVGPSPISGTGTQAAPTGTGSADRLVGGDSTHPTVAGHRQRAIAVVSKLAQAVNR